MERPVKWICADCPKEFDNRLKGVIHSVLSAFSLHKVVKERRSGEDRRANSRFQVSGEILLSEQERAEQEFMSEYK